MANTVSRRFVFIKMKRKRPLPKPKTPKDELKDGDEMIGEAARPTRAFKPPPLTVIAKRKSPLALFAMASGGVLGVALIVAFLASIATRTPTESGTTVAERRSSTVSNAGYARSRSGGGYPSGGHSGGSTVSGAPARAVGSAESFLAAPFPKRKPTTCAIQIDGGKESFSDFSKCLETAANDG